MIQKPIEQQQFIEKLNYVIRFNANLFNFTTSGENGQKINIPKSYYFGIQTCTEISLATIAE